MKSLTRRFSFLLIGLCWPMFLHGEDFHGASFSCIAVPQTNLNGVTMASEVRTSVKNISDEELVARYRIVITSTQGRTEGRGPANIKGRLPVHGAENLSLTPFEKASTQDEFPKTCQFTQIQVCPAKAPANFPKGAYFRPFLDGGKECKEVTSFTIALAVPQARAGCTAISKTWAMTEGYGHHYVYAIGTSPDDLNSAVAKAVMPSNDVEQGAVVMAKGCGPAHGAVAASLKHGSCSGTNCPILADGIYEEMAAALADSKDDAEQQALAGCHNSGTYKRAPYLDACVVIKSW